MASVRVVNRFSRVSASILRRPFHNRFHRQLCCVSKTHKNFVEHEYKFKGLFSKPTNHKLDRNLFTKDFHTTPRRYVPNPLFIVLAKKFAKFGAVILGRAIRKSVPKHENPHHSHYKLKMFVSLSLVGVIVYMFISYHVHKKEAPVTGRTRYIAFSNEQFKEIAKYELDVVLQDNKDKYVKPTNEAYNRVLRVVNRIITGNQDIEFFRKQNWTVTVLDTNDANAMVQPTGDIIVFNGLLRLAENDDQLAVVLAHELAHVYMSHGAEKVSVMNLVANAMIIMILAIWYLMPNDFAASLMHWLYERFLSVVLHLPYNRMLEDEADQVGLELMAKACYDVREAGNFWRRMGTLSVLEDEISLPEFLSTHPHHITRINRLDDLTYKALKTRIDCKCYRLPEKDPREEGERLYRLALQKQEETRRRAEQTVSPASK